MYLTFHSFKVQNNSMPKQLFYHRSLYHQRLCHQITSKNSSQLDAFISRILVKKHDARKYFQINLLILKEVFLSSEEILVFTLSQCAMVPVHPKGRSRTKNISPVTSLPCLLKILESQYLWLQFCDITLISVIAYSRH